MNTRILLGAVVASTLTASPIGPARSMELNTQIQIMKEVVELVRFGLDVKEQYGEVQKLDHVGPSVGEAQVNLDELAKRTASFKPQESVKPPVLDAADVFSPDKQVRERTRKDWENFLNDDENEIAGLKERRSRQQEALDRYRDRETALDKAGKAIEKAMADVPTSGVFGEDLGFAWYDVVVEAKPRMSGIVSDYERIVREYDRIIGRREVEHGAHVSTGAAVRAMQGADEAKAEGQDARNLGQPIVPPKAKPTNVNAVINQAVAGPGATPLAQAQSSKNSVGRMRDERAKAEAQVQQAQRPTQSATGGQGGGSSAPSDGNAGYGSSGHGTGGGKDGVDMSTTYVYPSKK